MIEDTASLVKRYARVVDGKPMLFTKCLWCNEEVEFYTSYGGVSGLGSGPDHSGGASCPCGWSCCSDGGYGSRLKELFDNPEEETKEDIAMEWNKKDREERKEMLGDLSSKSDATSLTTQNIVDRACRLGLPRRMSLVQFEDYIRGLYPEFYVKRIKSEDARAEQLEEEYEILYKWRTGDRRSELIAMLDVCPEAYLRARDLCKIWWDSDKYDKQQEEMMDKYPHFNGGSDTKAAVCFMYLCMHNHPDIKGEELRANEEFVRMVLGDSII